MSDPTDAADEGEGAPEQAPARRERQPEPEADTDTATAAAGGGKIVVDLSRVIKLSEKIGSVVTYAVDPSRRKPKPPHFRG